jgi:hypothetical protein
MQTPATLTHASGKTLPPPAEAACTVCNLMYVREQFEKFELLPHAPSMGKKPLLVQVGCARVYC